MSPPTDNIPSPRKRADFPQVFHHERTLANRLRETSRYVGGRNARWCGSSPRKRADFPQVFHHERTLANRLRETSRYVGGRNARWCGSRAHTRLAFHQMEDGLAYGSSAPGAYREGCYGGQME